MMSTPNTFHRPQFSHHEPRREIRADGGNQPVAGRQVQRARDGVEAAVPARGGHRATALALARHGS